MKLEYHTKPRPLAARWIRSGDEIAMNREPVGDDGEYLLPVRSPESASRDATEVVWCLVVVQPVLAPGKKDEYGTHVLTYAEQHPDGTAGPVRSMRVREGEQLVVREVIDFTALTKQPPAGQGYGHADALVGLVVGATQELTTIAERAEGQPEAAGVTAAVPAGVDVVQLGERDDTAMSGIGYSDLATRMGADA